MRKTGRKELGLPMLKKEDTRQLFIESLIELSQKKSIEKISVCDIVRNCGLGRQTFYYYFSTKYDLINWFYTSTVDSIIAQYKGRVPWSKVIGQALSFIYEYKNFFGNAINKEGQESFFNSFYEHTKDYYANYIRKNFGDDVMTADLQFAIKFNCYGAVCIDKEWIQSGMKEPPEIIAQRIADNMPNALKEYFY
jgi:probable dihydroxyacetone kinase regulator